MPAYFSSLDSTDEESIRNYEDYSFREYKFVHPVKEKIPFGPKVSHCQVREKFFWVSPEEINIEREITVSKIPYADYFTVRFLYEIVRGQGSGVDQVHKTKLNCKIYVNFTKSTTFKGRIQSGTLSENTCQWNDHLVPNIKEIVDTYLKATELAHLKDIRTRSHAMSATSSTSAVEQTGNAQSAAE